MNKDKSSDMKRGGMDHHMMNHDGDTTRKMDYDKSMGKNKMDSLRMKDHHMMRGDTSKMELKYNNPYQSDDKNVLKVDTAKIERGE